ncbi:hypothetical protein [Bosea sp. (in: a-proteobacteria)]|uniref:hypothetical protein n=1 Tax=Bosea sp. (in: a-proteobacteria) TaxID=1871050 RepID=UPI003B3A4807
MSKPKPEISGPISAIGYSSVRVADLTAAPNGESRAVSIEGADFRPVMDRIAARAGLVSFDPSTGVTTETPSYAPRLENLVDTIEQWHVEDLIENGCLVEPGEITVIGSDPEPGSDQWFSLTIVEKLRKAKRMLGEMSETQRQGLGLLFEAAALHGRYGVSHYDDRLHRVAEAGTKAAENGKLGGAKRQKDADLVYAAAVIEAKRLWALGSNRDYLLMSDHLIRDGRFRTLSPRRLKAKLKAIRAPK